MSANTAHHHVLAPQVDASLRTPFMLVGLCLALRAFCCKRGPVLLISCNAGTVVSRAGCSSVAPATARRRQAGTLCKIGCCCAKYDCRSSPAFAFCELCRICAFADKWCGTFIDCCIAVAGPLRESGCFSGLYMLANLWPPDRDFSPVVCLLPADLPKELICNVRRHKNLTCHCSFKCAVLSLILFLKLPCPVQSEAGAPPLCAAIEQDNVPLARSVSQGA